MYESEYVELAVEYMSLKVWEPTGTKDINLGFFSIWMTYKIMKLP